MKKVVIVILVLVAGLVGFNWFTTGEFSVIPSFGQPEDERALQALEDRFDAAVKQYSQAARSAGLSGIDTTADAEAARRTAEQVGKELKSLRARLTSESSIRKADDLMAAVQEFCR